MRIGRRIATVVAMAWLIGLPPVAAQVRTYRVLHVCACTEPVAAEERGELVEEFRKAGYAERKNLVLVSRATDSPNQAIRQILLEETRAARTDLILASGKEVATEAQALSGNIPAIFFRLTDPVGLGLVKTMARPGGNLTGISRGVDRLTAKRLQLLHEMVPKAQRVAYVYKADEPSQIGQLAEASAAAKALHIEIKAYPIPASSWKRQASMNDTFVEMKRDGIAAFLLPDISGIDGIFVRLAAEHRLPTIYSLDFVVTDFGGLASYGTGPWTYAEVVEYADKILKGTKPSDLPVREPKEFRLLFNASTAREQGVPLPRSFSLMGAEIVEAAAPPRRAGSAAR
jgi:putative tryptophan/tyrosine transport system substrate-binding protein